MKTDEMAAQKETKNQAENTPRELITVDEFVFGKGSKKVTFWEDPARKLTIHELVICLFMLVLGIAGLLYMLEGLLSWLSGARGFPTFGLLAVLAVIGIKYGYHGLKHPSYFDTPEGKKRKQSVTNFILLIIAIIAIGCIGGIIFK